MRFARKCYAEGIFNMNPTAIKEVAPKQETVTTNRLAFSIKDLSEMTSLSEAFFRGEIAAGRLVAKSFGTRVLVLPEDWLVYAGNQKQWSPKKRNKN